MSISQILKSAFPDSPEFKLNLVEQQIKEYYENIPENIASDELNIFGVETASHIDLTIKANDLETKARELYAEYRGFYDVVKFLWVKSPDGNDTRLVDLVHP